MRDEKTSQSRQTLLASLQLADGSLPIGRFAHSGGAESWLSSNPDATAEDLGQLIRTSLEDAVAPLDGAALSLAHSADTVAGLVELDQLLTAYKSSPASRAASQSCGRQLAKLAPRLVDDALLADYCGLVDARLSEGNLAIVEAATAKAAGISAELAVLVSLRSAASGMLSAAVRLGRLSPTTAQVMLAELAPSIDRATSTAIGTAIDDWHSTAPEIEIAMLASGRDEVSLFAS